MRPETKQLLKNISIGLGVFLLIGCMLSGVWYGTRLPALTIATVQVSGGETISHEQITDSVEQVLEGEYLRFVPRAFAWTYPENEIINLLQQTERVRDPVVRRDGTALRIELAEFEPVALWCDAVASESCVFLDANGYGFAQAPQLGGGAFVRYIKTGQPATTSAVYADTTDFAQLQELVAIMAAAGWPVSSVELDQVRDAFVFLAGGGELKTSLTITPQQTFANLQATLSADKYQHLDGTNFEYIDLRFGNKVFVKEFPDVQVATSTASTT